MRFVIEPDHPSLPGHFPGRPLVPGVVLLDRVVAAIEAAQGPSGPLRLPQVKFMQPLLPGEEARVELDACPADRDCPLSGAGRYRVAGSPKPRPTLSSCDRRLLAQLRWVAIHASRD